MTSPQERARAAERRPHRRPHMPADSWYCDGCGEWHTVREAKHLRFRQRCSCYPSHRPELDIVLGYCGATQATGLRSPELDDLAAYFTGRPDFAALIGWLGGPTGHVPDLGEFPTLADAYDAARQAQRDPRRASRSPLQ